MQGGPPSQQKELNVLKNGPISARFLRGLFSPKPAADAALVPWVQDVPAPQVGFTAAPEIIGDQAGYTFIIEALSTRSHFLFCKLNHGFWERLASLEDVGISTEDILERDGAKIDAALGVSGSKFAEGGLLAELIVLIQRLPAPETGVHFVASLSPWPASDRIEGTPLKKRAQCEAVIAHVVPSAHLQNIQDKEFTGHEFKVAAITGGLRLFLDAIRDRDTIFVGNPFNRALIDAAGFPRLRVIEVDIGKARLSSAAIYRAFIEALEASKDELPIVVGSAGGAMTTWLALKAWEEGLRFQFVDVGGMLAAYSEVTANRANWTRAYGTQLLRNLPKLGIPLPQIEHAFTGKYGQRDEILVELACDAGVTPPSSCLELPTPMPHDGVAFVENKRYDLVRIGELLDLSVRVNHHANGGPVTTLLERMIAKVADLATDRRVIAVSNGTVALQLAAGFYACPSGKAKMRWVTSAFGFFSVNVGPLGNSLIIDCDKKGRLSLEALREVPLSDYDGVIYTNVFARQSDWDDIAGFCRENGKAFIVDNAT
ncbi:hypothetical protein, partial [Roseibium sp.]|uniref:hypothetical protein n=1 Tax=Roseibium sp. TaxID=1936156 RepID=UPI003296D2F2